VNKKAVAAITDHIVIRLSNEDLSPKENDSKSNNEEQCHKQADKIRII